MAKAAKKPKAKKKPNLKVLNGGKKKKKIIIKDETAGNKPKLHAEMKLELLDLTGQIRKGSEKLGGQYYDVGAALRTVRDKKLFVADGHKSFNAWLDSEKFFNSRATAYNMIAVAEKLSREKAIKYGPSIAYVVARATDEKARTELEQMAEEGASAGDLKRAAQEQRAGAGVQPRSPGRPKKTVRRAVNHVNGNGSNGRVEVDLDDLKKRAKKAQKTGVAATGTVLEVKMRKMKNTKANKEAIKEGWTHTARFQLGSNGPDLMVEVNVALGELRCRVM